MQASRIVAQSLDEEIETLMTQREFQLQSLSKLGKNKSKFEANIMVVVNDFSSQITALKDTIGRNQLEINKISEQVSRIF